MDMGGWDVVSLVTISFVNAAIQDQRSSPTNMNVSTDTMVVGSRFGVWQVTVGGSGNLLRFDIPLMEMSGRVTKAGQPVANFTYPSLTARVELALTFIDSGPSGKSLIIDSKSPPTTVISLVDSNGQPLSQVLDDAFIKQALTTWFSQNLSQFKNIFASVSLDPNTSADAQWAFCKPSVVAFTYISGSSLENSYLGLTYNTGGKTTPGTAAQIDPSFIPAGCQAAFMISPALFLASFLAPSSCAQFKMPAQALNVDTSVLQATLAPNSQIPMAPVPTSDGDCQPYLTDFQLSVQNSIVTTYAKTSAVVLDKWYGTVTAFNESQSWMTLNYDMSRNALAWSNTQASTNNHTIEQSESFEIIQDVLEIIGILTLAVATVLTDGMALLIVGALCGIAQGGIQWALNDFESNNVDDAPEIDDLVSNISLPAQWSGGGPFAVAQAGLHQGGFFLAGNIRTMTPDEVAKFFSSGP